MTNGVVARMKLKALKSNKNKKGVENPKGELIYRGKLVAGMSPKLKSPIDIAAPLATVDEECNPNYY